MFLSKNNIIISIKNYSFTLSPNNLALLSRIENKTNNKILMCACKKYIHGQKNGILLLKIDFDNFDKNKIKITEKLHETENFEVYCFCQILKFYNINDIKIVNTQFNNLVFTQYILVGGFDLVRTRGIIKLFQINEKNKEITIEFIQNIEIENNNVNSNFKGFQGPITCITQSKLNGKIFVTCFDGNVHLFTFPNV